ncbi:MAG: hypothetical protein H0V29_12120 [Thermoleophilaceae bacterium]|nr:hypothetical protein [Thermoleophilaceae bacterium]
MPEQAEQPQPPKRGDALWRQQLADTAKRNAEASKKGKADREKKDQAAMARRAANEREQDEGLVSKSKFNK